MSRPMREMKSWARQLSITFISPSHSLLSCIELATAEVPNWGMPGIGNILGNMVVLVS